MTEYQEFHIYVVDSLGNGMELLLPCEAHIQEIVEKLRLIPLFFGFPMELVSEYFKEEGT